MLDNCVRLCLYFSNDIFHINTNFQRKNSLKSGIGKSDLVQGLVNIQQQCYD